MIVYSRKCQIFQITQIKVGWKLPKQKKGELSTNCESEIKLVGMMCIVCKHDLQHFSFFSERDSGNNIIGTQLMIDKKHVLRMTNFLPSQFKFETSLSHTGFKKYFCSTSVDDLRYL